MSRRTRPQPVDVTRAASRVTLAALLVAAGVSHLTWGRRGYRIVVPDWATTLLRTDKDAIIVASGAVEIMLGAALVALPKERRTVGGAIAAFFVAVFPGNVHQWRTGRSAPLLRTDRSRLLRLFLQVPLIAVTLWSTTTPAAGAARRGRRR